MPDYPYREKSLNAFAVVQHDSVFVDHNYSLILYPALDDF